MFDTTKFYIHMTDLVCNRLQDNKVLKDHGTKIYGNKFYLKHPFGLKNPSVFIDFENRSLCLETSLPKLLQGHNVFGTNRLEYMCLSATKLIYHQLGLEFNRQERRKVQDERFRLGRVDGTCSFRMATPQQVAEALEAIFEQYRAEGLKWSGFGKFGVETVYNQQHSKRVADKFYNKYVELKNKIPLNVAECDYILKFVRTLLRFEVSWRGKELSRIGYDYADQWSLELLKQMIYERLERFNFQGVIKDRLVGVQLDGLNDSLRMYYDLWEQGANLLQHRNNRTLGRARDQFLEQHQVDIYRPAAVGCDIPLNQLLSMENAYFTAPKYLTRRGALFGFSNTLA